MQEKVLNETMNLSGFLSQPLDSTLLFGGIDSSMDDIRWGFGCICGNSP